jgi:hypothetical protein
MAPGPDTLRLAEVYSRYDVDIDIEGGFFSALGLKDHLQTIEMSRRD